MTSFDELKSKALDLAQVLCGAGHGTRRGLYVPV